MNILGAPDVESVHAAGIELMREVAFDSFTALPLHPLASSSPDASPVTIHRFLFCQLAFPVARSPIRFRDVSPHLQLAQADYNLVAVVSLVRHHFFHSTGMDLVFAFRWCCRN